MALTKKTGRILGFLFLLTVLAGATGTAFRGLGGAEANSTEFLEDIMLHMGQMKLAISLDILASAIGVGIALFLYSFIKKYDQRLAIAYLTIAGINFTIIVVSNIIHVNLLSLSEEFAVTTAETTDHFTTLAKMLHEAYYWTHFLMLMLYSIGGSVLYYFLFRTKLVPVWLSIWGILASIVVFFGGALQLADIKVSGLLFVQNGIYILTFIIWLLVKGFNPKYIKSLE
ncbi:MAG: DUF4386 domain-containing protein [Eudoraea sp.]|nr:DUF4386 domain-containing protein [Eudoraea sp.]NNL03566.1 DUF4386 domain-containing protein [Eudoraea sp.]